MTADTQTQESNKEFKKTYIQSIMKKALKILGIIMLSLLIFLICISFLINKENLNYNTKLEMLDANDVKKLSENDTIFVAILSTSCPGKAKSSPILKKNIEKLKKNKQTLIIIADELFSDQIENEINQFKNEYKIYEKIYLFNKKTYPKNGGLFNNKERFNSFITDFAGQNHNLPLGYVLYLKIFKGEILSFNSTIE